MMSSEHSETVWITSVELIEKTGISRATLNNYIKMGILPKPLVKRPEDPNLRAKQIGYFPSTVLDSISTVQQMKEQGKSMEAIVKAIIDVDYGSKLDVLLKKDNPSDDKIIQSNTGVGKGNTGDIISLFQDKSTEGIQDVDTLKLTIGDVLCPAFLINNKFEIEWINKDAEKNIFNIEVSLMRDASERNVFKLFSKMGLLTGSENIHDLVTYMMKFVKFKLKRNEIIHLYNGILGREVSFLEGVYDSVEPLYSDSLRGTYLNIGRAESNAISAYHGYHIVFREGILCLLSPMDNIFHGIVDLLSSRGKVIHELMKQRMPSLVSFCVLVADVQDSSRICAELPPEEYFGLIRDIWKCMEGSFRKYYGTYGKHVGDGMVYYFLKDRDNNYILNSVYCALELREKMKQLNMEWKVRKGWLNDIYLNIGINEGQEYFGSIPSSPNIEFTALGDSVNYAGRLSDLARFGSIWTTKNLVNHLEMEQRRKLHFGIRRKDQDREIFVENTFSRVMDMLRHDDPKYSKFMDIATLAVTEILSVSAAEPA